jgi:hypothetical protein
MTTVQILAILGAGAGSAGSIITAFSMNAILSELDFARRALGHTTEALASNQRDIPVFTGFDDRIRRASRSGSRWLWIGVLLLAAGFILQAVSVCKS